MGGKTLAQGSQSSLSLCQYHCLWSFFLTFSFSHLGFRNVPSDQIKCASPCPAPSTIIKWTNLLQKLVLVVFDLYTSWDLTNWASLGDEAYMIYTVLNRTKCTSVGYTEPHIDIHKFMSKEVCERWKMNHLEILNYILKLLAIWTPPTAYKAKMINISSCYSYLLHKLLRILWLWRHCLSLTLAAK